MELLIEVGCEEIPARWVASVAQQLGERLEEGLKGATLREAGAPTEVFWTARRLGVHLAGVAARQPDREREVIGPPARMAFGVDGTPTPQALAFAAKNGAGSGDLYATKTPKGDYAAVRCRSAGREAATVVAELLPDCIAALELPKSMRWEGDGVRFIRPIRWLVALLDGSVVPGRIGGLVAGRTSWGHRSLAPGPVTVAAADRLVAELERTFVMALPFERRRRIEAGLAAALGPGERLRADEPLLETLVNLAEFPTVLRGAFDLAFLDLPAEVLVTVMRDHQKYFAVEVAGAAPPGEASLVPAFLAVMDLDRDREGLIRHGHERVLRARFNDARFFWDTDRKRPLADRREDLKHVTFHGGLGTYYDKTQRTLRLAEDLAAAFGAEVGVVREAAELAKCDLTTDLVKEFTELQGIMGALYARAEGRREAVVTALYDQYLPLAADGAAPRTREAAALAIADKLDTLAGLFSLGERPTGSRDPFALRRAANGVIRALRAHELRVNLAEKIDQALDGLSAAVGADARTQARGELLEFFLERQEFYLREVDGMAADEAAAALAAGAGDPVEAAGRAAALHTARRERPEQFARAAGALKRMRNIVRKEGGPARWRAMPVDSARFQARPERELAAAVEKIVRERGREGTHYAELQAIAALAPGLEEFFEQVRVNDPDPALRANRLALLARAVEELSRVADFSQIVIAGERESE